MKAHGGTQENKKRQLPYMRQQSRCQQGLGAIGNQWLLTANSRHGLQNALAYEQVAPAQGFWMVGPLTKQYSPRNPAFIYFLSWVYANVFWLQRPSRRTETPVRTWWKVNFIKLTLTWSPFELPIWQWSWPSLFPQAPWNRGR